MRTLLVVYQSRSGGTQSLVDAAVEGALLAVAEMGGASPGVVLDVRHAFDTGPDEVKAASAILIATPANFGYMSGAVKDFFERIYHACLEVTAGMPYAMIVKGDTDVDGAASSVERIATGMRWREVLPKLSVVGGATTQDVDAAIELGATLAAGLEAGIY